MLNRRLKMVSRREIGMLNKPAVFRLLWSLHLRLNFMSTYHGLMPINASRGLLHDCEDRWIVCSSTHYMTWIHDTECPLRPQSLPIHGYKQHQRDGRLAYGHKPVRGPPRFYVYCPHFSPQNRQWRTTRHLDDCRAKFGSSGVIYKCRMPPHPGQTGPMRTAYLIHLIKTIPQQLQRNKCKR